MAAPAVADLTIGQAAADHFLGLEDFETIAQEVSGLGQKVSDLETRLEHVEEVNTGLEEAALTTARALQEISAHWDKVYEAIRRRETMH